VVAVDEGTGATLHTKTASTPEDPSAGLLEGLQKILRRGGLRAADVSAVIHGTTVSTNAILEHKLARVGLVVTRGFRCVLEIARQSVPLGYGNSYFWVKPPRLVSLENVREVTERLDFRGNVLVPFDEEEARRAARWFRGEGIDAVAVCFLHAYANPEHERRMEAVLRAEHPAAFVSLSSAVLPEYREYERAVTTVLDVMVKHKVQHYIDRSAGRLREGFPGVPFLVMKSNGGMVSAEEIPRRPITTVLSGPAAGVAAACFVGRACGFQDLLTFDAGGTSTDVCLVEGGEAQITTWGKVGRHTVKTSMVDIVSVGTGGGSIAWIGPDRNLKVGPQSAGAHPGPACYGRGGAEATLTDANLVLGRIPPHLLGGEILLREELAQEAISRLARSLDLDPLETAAGIAEIANWNQANSIRQVTIQRGRDPRRYALVAFGGSGPMQAGRVAEILRIETIIVPPDPGVTSAFGLGVVDFKNDYVVTRVERSDLLDLEAVGRAYTRLEAEGDRDLAKEGVPPERRALLRSMDMRYVGEADEVRVDVPRGGPLAQEDVRRAEEAFHQAHERLYGYCYRGTQRMEVVNLRVTAVGATRRPTLPTLPRANGGAPAPKGERQVSIDRQGGFRPAPLYDRRALLAGHQILGPAVIEEYGSTTLLLSGQRAEVHPSGSLIVHAAAAGVS
jgi:N-methylhydantoinase A